jgi:hypothetical protein
MGLKFYMEIDTSSADENLIKRIKKNEEKKLMPRIEPRS